MGVEVGVVVLVAADLGVAMRGGVDVLVAVGLGAVVRVGVGAGWTRMLNELDEVSRSLPFES